MKNGLRKAATSLLLIVIVAAGMRVGLALYEARQFSPRVLTVVPFQTETGHIAYSIATGKGFSSPFQRDTGPTAWLAPAYPYLLAGIVKIFGIYTLASFFAAVSLNILFSVGTCVPIFYAGKRIAGLGVASGAAWLWAFFPNAILIPFEWIWDTSLSALLVAALLWATLKLAETGPRRDWCLYGLLWGFSLLANPAIGLLFPVFLLWAGYRHRASARAQLWLVRPAVAAAIALLCCVPWTVRNYILFHKLVPLRSNFAFELYVGNNENYDEENRLRPPVVTQNREIVRYIRMGETAFMEEEKKKAIKFIESHPRVELWLISQRFVAFWTGTASPLDTFRQADSLLLRLVLLCNDVAPLFALLGAIVLLAKRSEYALPMVSVPLIFPLLYYATHTSLRYRHPIDPVVLLLAAIGVHRAWSSFRHNNQRPGEEHLPIAS
ncbi:MAG: ArnT family glycosyltransferase [Candidatus Acidiferrum sp.]